MTSRVTLFFLSSFLDLDEWVVSSITMRNAGRALIVLVLSSTRFQGCAWCWSSPHTTSSLGREYRKRNALSGLPSRSSSQTGRLYLARSLSASEQARREEDNRRQERAEDVVIGKTSALPGASDYALNPSATEAEYLRQASRVEQIVYKETEKGLEALKMLRISEAIESFDKVFELRPNAYCWQAGIAKFYAGDLEGAADVFARNAVTYENKFGAPASEERIWRHACELKLITSMSRKDRKLVEDTGGVASILAPIPLKDYTAELLKSENRRVVRISLDLFSSSIDRDHSGLILSRAKLRAIGGTPGVTRRGPILDRKMWKLSSWYYLGLHYDAIGDTEESKRCMKRALRLCPNTGITSDITLSLPFIHMSQREWFDDDELESAEASDTVSMAESVSSTGGLEVNPLIVESIKASIDDLRTVDLQEALRDRELKVTGSKEDLKQRLYESLIEDAGIELVYNIL
jgi:tetratricopeptide (TPR) repeat protein